MALSTGSQSLRGVGPRAPVVDQRAFDLDVEALGRAATLPGRVTETIEDLGERRADRAIRNETRPARRRVALATAEGEALRAPIEQEVLGAQARGAAERVGAQQEVLTGQARGAASRVAGEQELLGREVGRDIEQFDTETEAQRADRLSRINAARRKAEQDAQELQVLEENEAENLMFGRQAAADRVTQQQVKGLEAERKRLELEGTPETRLTENDQGQFEETFITMPTGEERITGRKQRKTAQQIALERQEIETARRSAEALATQRENAAARTGNKVAVRERTSPIGETVGFTVITTSEDGRVIATEEIAVGEATPRAGGAGIDDIRQSFTAPAPVQENGRQFVPTGENVGGYRRGIIYTHPQLGRVLYSGGDPFDPNSFQPVQ